jgi:hypothetical protein
MAASAFGRCRYGRCWYALFGFGAQQFERLIGADPDRRHDDPANLMGIELVASGGENETAILLRGIFDRFALAAFDFGFFSADF